MGKGQRSAQSYKTTDFITQPRDTDGLLRTASANDVGFSHIQHQQKLMIHKRAKSMSAERQLAEETNMPEEEKQEKELESVPTFILVTTYLSYLMLIMLAHARDFFGKLWRPQDYVQLRVQNGYAPMVSDFESLWLRRLYGRIRDCFNRPITGVAGGRVNLVERESKDFNRSFEFTGRVVNALNLASYNYLGFAQSEGPCADKVEAAMQQNGIITASTRAEAGKSVLLKETEDMVARFVGAEAALIVSMGYATNALNIPALAGKGSLIVSDELNHSSLVAGARLSGSVIRVFKHNDTEDLEKVLRRSISQGQPRTHRPWKKILVVVEGLYSMEGQFCRLPEIVELKRRYKFHLFLDEAHSIGALGPRGRGICDHFGIDPRDIDILMGTFTKSFGAAGGYIAGTHGLVDFLRLHSHSAVYGESMSVPVLAQVRSSMGMIMGEDQEHALEGQQRLDQLAINSRYFARRLKELGFMTMGDPGSPVVPLLLFSPAKIPAFSRECLKRKIAVVVVSYPATPIITGRVRFCISASHTRDDLDYALDQISEIGDLLLLKFHAPSK